MTDSITVLAHVGTVSRRPGDVSVEITELRGLRCVRLVTRKPDGSLRYSFALTADQAEQLTHVLCDALEQL